jgi:hypothetical protein
MSPAAQVERLLSEFWRASVAVVLGRRKKVSAKKAADRLSFDLKRA